MRYEDLRRPRGIESLWLRLRFALARPLPRRAGPVIGDLSRLSDRQLEDIGLKRCDGRSTVSFWHVGG